MPKSTNELNELCFNDNIVTLFLGGNTEIILNKIEYSSQLHKLFGFNNQIIIKDEEYIKNRYEKINLTIPNQIVAMEKNQKYDYK